MMTNKERELAKRVSNALSMELDKVVCGLTYLETIEELVKVIENGRASN